MGLLGNGWEDPQSSAIMALAGGLLKGDFGGGLLGANDAFAQAKQAAMKKQLFDIQLQEAQQKMEDQRRQRDFLQNLPDPQMLMGQSALAAGGGPTVANASKVPPTNPVMSMLYQGAKAGAVPYGDYLKALMPAERINKLDAKDFTPESVQKFNQTGNYGDLVRLDKLHFGDMGGSMGAFNPFTGQQVASAPKTGDPFKDLLVTGPNGGLVPNAPLISAKSQIAKAGANNVNLAVNTDKSYFGNVAEGLAKNDVALIDAARSAPDRIASSRRVQEILATNPITGTGAEARLALNKALATAGLVDGTNVANTEMLASTLASQTLDAIKTSGLGSGQGFTDKDRQFLERAKSGNIEMNAESLRRIAQLNEASARATIQRGNSVINKLRASPEAGKMGQQLDPIQEPTAQPQTRQQVFDAKPAANMANKGKVLTDTVTGQKWRSNGLAWVEEK